MYYQPSTIEYKFIYLLFALQKTLLRGERDDTKRPLERENSAPEMIQKHMKREAKTKFIHL